MGRLQKKKIDKIQQMLEQDFTGAEISKAAGCSISTVYRIKKNHFSAPKPVVRARMNAHHDLFFVKTNK